jgi:hypothetical protein
MVPVKLIILMRSLQQVIKQVVVIGAINIPAVVIRKMSDKGGWVSTDWHSAVSEGREAYPILSMPM